MDVMTDIALEPETIPRSRRFEPANAAIAARAAGVPVLDVVIPVYNGGPRWRNRCIGYTAICGISSRFRPASRSRTMPASMTRPESPKSRRRARRRAVVRLEEKGRGRALHVGVVDLGRRGARIHGRRLVDRSGSMAPLVAPLISGHSDLAIGTRLGRGARVVRGPKREIISRCYNLILKSTLAAGFSDAQCGFKAVRADVAHRLLPHITDTGGSSTPSCWCWPNVPACASTKSPWTGSTIPTAGSTSWRPRRPTSRAWHGCCAASPRAPSGANACGAARSVTVRRGARVTAATIGAVRQRRGRLHGRLPAALHAAARVAWRPGREPDRVAGHRDRQHRGQPPLHVRIADRAGAARHHVEGLIVFGIALAITSGALATLHLVVPEPGRYIDATVLVAANLLATAVRFVLLRGWVFHPRRNR